ncbi:MAG: hypothetical protein HZC18_01605 [Candidatus Omnitrophica bacterium]|nr:hypothetical protein [Candidatus Omnitrophota bacterium]
MTYLLLGEDSLAKDQKITELKEEILPSTDALAFDYESLDGAEVDARVLHKALLALPVIGRRRLVVLRCVHKLDAQSKEILSRCAAQKRDDIVVVLEAGDTQATNAFMKSLAAHSKVINVATRKRQNVFDVTNALSAHDPVEACAILNNLFAQGDHPLQIVGGLIWFWGKSRLRLSDENFRKGLEALQEADLNIKRSRLKPEHGVELLVVKLAGLYGKG